MRAADRLVSNWWVPVGLLLMILAVFAQSYQGRVDLRGTQVAGCERAVQDRQESVRRDLDLAAFARRASQARRADGDDQVAVEYARIADRADRRARSTRSRIVDCEDAFPRPSLSPL